MHPRFTMTFPSFHFTTLAYPSHPHQNSLHFTPLHFTSLHFRMISLIPLLRLIYYFPIPFPITQSLETPRRFGQNIFDVDFYNRIV
jgi:hypothetical protein